MYGVQLSNAIASLLPFDVEVDFDMDDENDLVVTIQGATLDIGGSVVPNLREYEVRGEITIPYVWRGEATDADDARDKAEGAIAVYVDDINTPTGHGIEGMEIFPPDYTLNSTREA